MLSEIQLTQQQTDATLKLTNWFNEYPDTKRPFFVLEGYAGTGKSFTLSTIVKSLGIHPAYMCYTGKAALVLQKYSQIPARTIHSSIYHLDMVEDDVFKRLYKERDEAEGEERAKIIEEIKKLEQPVFTLNEEALEGFDAIVLDECSMVDDEVLTDLLSFNLPIIALGDPGQLPPIKGEGALFRDPGDARLTEILRQAADNPIIDWSMRARQGLPIRPTDVDSIKDDLVSKVPHTIVGPDLITELVQSHDIVICWKNITRQRLNTWMRKGHGYYDADPTFPVVGERIIFTKNDRKRGVFNGLAAEVKEVGQMFDFYFEATVETEVHPGPVQLEILRYPFEKYQDEKAGDKVPWWEKKDRQEADFGYALTCHKAQGSQWEKVLIFEENCLSWPKAADDRKRWLYTAMTRAIEKMTMLTGKVG